MRVESVLSCLLRIIVLNMSDRIEGFETKEIIGIILAGGQSRRFGDGDKFFRKLNGKSLIDHVIERLQPQTDDLVINSNSDANLFLEQGLTVVPDTIQGFAGPLAGILTGMEWVLRNKPQYEWIATFPSDAPFIPHNCVKEMRLCAKMENTDIVCTASGQRTHPVCALWRIDLAADLRKVMINEGLRKIDLWTARHQLSIIKFPDHPYDPFFNINRPEDMVLAEKIMKSNALEP